MVRRTAPRDRQPAARSIRRATKRALAGVRFRSRRLVVVLITGPVTTLLRRRARRARRMPGVTIITVNFNTLPFLRVMCEGIRRHSPATTRILVVDNASTDGSRRWLEKHEDVDVISLPVNVNHGPAMDIGILACRTDTFVALDVDAFPLADTWLVRLLEPLSRGVAVSGAELQWDHIEPYVHACCLAMRTARFVEKGHTFRSGPTWDTAQRISQLEHPNIHTFPATHTRGPVAVGTVFGGDLIYHNFYSARFEVSHKDRLDEQVTRQDPALAWSEAMARYFPDLDLREANS